MKFVSYLPAAAVSTDLFLTPCMSASPSHSPSLVLSAPCAAVHVGNTISAHSHARQTHAGMKCEHCLSKSLYWQYKAEQLSELTSKLAVRRHAILEARGVRPLTTLTPLPYHRQAAASITGLSVMNGGCVTCRAWSQDGALFAALWAAGCGVRLLCKHAVGLSEIAHLNQAKDADFSATTVAEIDYRHKCGQGSRRW